jgi:hypothetical protein
VVAVTYGVLTRRWPGAQPDAVAAAAGRVGSAVARLAVVVRAAAPLVVLVRMVGMVVQTSAVVAVVVVARSASSGTAARVVQAPSFSCMNHHI